MATKTTQRTSTSAIAARDPVSQYASKVVAGKIVAGPLVRLACQRHLDDLKHGPKRGLKWMVQDALRAIDFFPDVLRLAEGQHAGQPFVLQPWQKFIVGSLFGWKAADSYRRFRTAYIEIGKGSGKSPLAAGIGLYMLTADGEAGAECYAAATTRDQAGILFQDAVKMVDASPALSARIQKSGNRQVFNLAHLASGSYFRPVSSEGRGLDGKRVHYAAIDEVHEHPDPVVVNKMRAGTKGRRQALIFEITNSGYDRHSVCWNHHEYSRKIVEGILENDSWFAYVCGLDEKDDWRNPKCWLKANPNLGVSITHKYLAEQVKEAIGIPSQENIVKRLNFCIWTEQAQRWMPMDIWDACAEPDGFKYTAEDLLGQPCFGGLDLSLTRDISAFVLLFPPNGERTKWCVLAYFWVPEEDMRERSRRDHVPYDVWVRQGLMTATPGNVVDHDYIENAIRDLATKYQMQEIPFDRALAAQLVTHLLAEGLPMVQFAQGPLSMNPGVRTLEKHLLGKQLAHGGHPILRWMASNVAIAQDSNGNVKFDKAKSTERIDGMVCLAMDEARAEALAAIGYTPTEVMVV